MAASAAGADARQLVETLSNLESVTRQALVAASHAEDVCRGLGSGAAAGRRSLRAALADYRAGDVVSRIDAIRDHAEQSVDNRVRVHGWALTERLEEFLGEANETARLVRAAHDAVARLERECDDASNQTQGAYLDLGVIVRALNDIVGEAMEAQELAEAWPRATVADVRAGATTVKGLLRSARLQFDINAQGRIESRRSDLFDEHWDHGTARDQYATVVRTCEQIPGLMDQADAECDALLEALTEIAES